MSTRYWMACLLALVGVEASINQLLAQSVPTPIALSGTAAPAGGNYGTFSTTGSSTFLPVINNAGRVEFYSTLTGGSSTAGIFLSNGGTVQAVALQGTASPAGSNFTDSFSSNQVNNNGQVTFSCTLANGLQAVFVGLPGSLQTVAIDGTASPGGGGNYNSLFSSPLVNSAGKVIFSANLTGGTATRGLFTGTPGTVQAVALQGSSTPGGGTYNTNFSAAMNDSGQVFLNAGISGVAGVTNGLFTGMPGSLSTVALQGNAAPAGGNYQFFSRFVGNNAGQVIFRSSLTGGSATSGIFTGTPGSLQALALQGTAAPAGGNYASFVNHVMNGSGQVAFQATLTGGSSTGGIFVGTPGSIQATVLLGTAAPGGGNFNAFSSPPDINASGKIAFLATLTGAGVDATNDAGLYVGSIGALQKVIRKGDIVDVNPGPGVDSRTVSAVGFIGAFGSPAGQDGFSTTFTDSGFITYTLAFTDGSSGVFTSTTTAVPEPATIVILTLLAGSAGIWGWRQRAAKRRAMEAECGLEE